MSAQSMQVVAQLDVSELIVPELVAQASAVGLVSHREILNGVVSVRHELQASNVHTILVRDHPVAYVKQQGAAAQLDRDDVIGRERQTLTCLQDADLAPRLLVDQPGDALWVGVVRGETLGAQQGNVPELAEVCQAWGAAVAELHRTPTAGHRATVAPRPWVLHPARRARSMYCAASGIGRAAVLSAVDNEPALRAAADSVDQRWTTLRWIHGDLSAANVVVETAPALRVRFVNFENAGLGDPSWDLASAVDTITLLAPRWHAPAGLLVEYFLRGYHRGDGPGRLSPSVQAVRALATAWQVAGREDEQDSPESTRLAEVQDWLDRARGFAVRAVMVNRAVA